MGMNESEGTWSGDWQPVDGRTCPRCGATRDVEYRIWESECGGYEDVKFRCRCGYYWWVDGPDA